MWSAAQKHKNIMDLMFMLGLKETIDQLAMANRVGMAWYGWYGDVLRREGGNVLRIALDFDIEGQRNGRPKMMWEKQVEKEGIKVGLRREDALCHSKWSVSVSNIAAGLR